MKVFVTTIMLVLCLGIVTPAIAATSVRPSMPVRTAPVAPRTTTPSVPRTTTPRTTTPRTTTPRTTTPRVTTPRTPKVDVKTGRTYTGYRAPSTVRYDNSFCNNWFTYWILFGWIWNDKNEEERK